MDSDLAAQLRLRCIENARDAVGSWAKPEEILDLAKRMWTFVSEGRVP